MKRDRTKILFPAAESCKILFLAAEPCNVPALRLGQAWQKICDQLQRSDYGHRFAVDPRFSVQPVDLSHALLKSQPDIVHFAGHGKSGGEPWQSDDGLWLEDPSGRVQAVGPEALAAVFKVVSPPVKCVVLNTCQSDVMAAAVAQHVPFAIGMNEKISNPAAIAFSLGFYKALGANQSIEQAYQLGCAEISIHGHEEQLTPALYRSGIQINRQFLEKSDRQTYLFEPATGPNNWTTESIKGQSAASTPNAERSTTDDPALQSDLDRLGHLMAAGRWKEANDRTRTLLLKAVNRQQEGWIEDKQLQGFPCAILLAVDRLWLRHSQGQFGFSVQKRFFEECGREPDVFAERVGWRDRNGTWIDASSVIYTPETAPAGHLPWGILQAMTLDSAILDAFVGTVRATAKAFSKREWQRQWIVDAIALGSSLTGDKVNKEDLKRSMEYELTQTEGWWEGARLEQRKVVKLFSLFVACPNLGIVTE